MRMCKECGQATGRGPTAEYCHKCAIERNRRRSRERRRGAYRSRPRQFTCSGCGQTFEGEPRRQWCDACHPRPSRVKARGGDPESCKSGDTTTVEGRREYQRRYYQKHKKKCREYQRRYTRQYRSRHREARFEASREIVRTTFNTSELMQAPAEKAARMLDQILRRERGFTM